MSTRKDAVERRKHKRFKAKEGAFAILTADKNRMGQIKDISKGGLTFQYIDSGEPPKSSVEVEIFLALHDFYLKKLPIKNIEEFEIDNPLPFSSLPMRQLSIQFGKMKPIQKSLLEHFLQNYTD